MNLLVTDNWCYVAARHGHDSVADMHHKESRSSNIDASSHLLSEPVVIYHVDGSPSAAAAGTDHPGQLHDLSDKEKEVNVDDRQKQLASVECDVETGSLGMHRNHHGGHHHATRSLILILALSLHRIFEGMSIGLQQTVASVISLFGAVMCHEMVIGFSLGLQFVRSGFALRRLLITSLVCSLIMPLGVLIGLVMTEVDSSSGIVDIANGILQAIAMGTFIYVTFFEILQEEVDSDDTSIGKIVFIAVGFALMALLNLVPEDIGTSARHLDTTTTVLPVNVTANGCVG